jgi:hypothetical protein
MDQQQPVDRMAANAPPNSKKPSLTRAVGANGPPAPWLKALDSYNRRERREYQVTRFG